MSVTSLRELNRRALDPAHSVVVSACAGSGKTWLLVSRIVRELLAGAEPSQILAITFTRKAAQEMASRLRTGLRELATKNDEGVRAFLRQRSIDPATVDTLLGRAREQFERVLAAEPPITITTFHGWFLQLLRNAPLEAGALGAVSLIERTSDLLGEAWTRLMADCQRAPQSAHALAIQALFAAYGLHNTRQLLRSFVAHRCDWWAYSGNADQAVVRTLEHLERAMTVAPDVDVRARLLGEPGFERTLRSLAELLCANTPTDRNDGNAICAALEQAFPGALFDAVRKTVLKTTDGEPKVRKSTKAQAQRLGAKGQARLLELHAEVSAAMRTACIALADQVSYRANAWGLTAGVALLERFQDIKRERQLVDFADVEWLAYATLAKSDHAITLQYKLDNRYRHVLLDEFQDTNPLQWLALRAWLDAARQSGEMPNLFIVGDPKQSIYRFRRAEPQLFAAARALVLEEGGVALSQDESFRCAQAVLDVVNGVFAGDPLVPEFELHAAHRPQLPGRVEVLPLTRLDEPTAFTAAAALELRNPLREPRVLPEDRRREYEAQTLAERLIGIVSGWQIVDEAEPSGTRRARFGDIMVLVRQRTHLEVYERALRRAQIPYLTSRQGGLLGTLEAADLSALLAFLVAPFDDLKLAHVLRSPLFACSDDELIAIAQAPGKTWWDRLLYLAGAGASANLARARRLLAQWRERADAEPVHDQLDRIYFEGDVLRRYRAAVPEAMRAAVVANLQAFIQHALDVDSGRYPSLPRFLAQLREMGAAPAEEAPDEGLLGSHGNAVRILTIHGAKGLEAPIVWLLNSSAPRMKDPGYNVLVDWPGDAEQPASVSLWTRTGERSGAQRSLAALEESRAEREELNLLYVAMTRARQALFVSGCELKAASDSWYARVRDAVVELSGSVPADRDTAVEYGQDLSMPHAAAIQPAGTPAQPLQIELDWAGADLQHPVPTGERRALVGGKGFDYGTGFHRLMELLTVTPSRTAEHARKQLRLPAVGFEAMWSQARGLLAEPKLARFFDPGQYRHALNEISFVTAAGELRRIDRLIEFDHEVWVLDYKAGSRASVSGSVLETEYRVQVGDYCESLRQVYPDKPVRGKILFADGSQIDL